MNKSNQLLTSFANASNRTEQNINFNINFNMNMNKNMIIMSTHNIIYLLNVWYLPIVAMVGVLIFLPI